MKKTSAPSTPSARQIERTIFALLDQRGPEKTICPSEVARALAARDWRALMPHVRDVAARLRARDEVLVTQRGTPVDPHTARGPIRIARAHASPYRGIDFRAHPERYRVGRGEEGVLNAEPYKSELLPLWRFRTPGIARRSAIRIWNAFVRYRRAGDFVGMDMARKYLQMGFTRARRYANRSTGEAQMEKARAADEFRIRWQRALRDVQYREWRALQARRPTSALRCD